MVYPGIRGRKNWAVRIMYRAVNCWGGRFVLSQTPRQVFQRSRYSLTHPRVVSQAIRQGRDPADLCDAAPSRPIPATPRVTSARRVGELEEEHMPQLQTSQDSLPGFGGGGRNNFLSGRAHLTTPPPCGEERGADNLLGTIDPRGEERGARRFGPKQRPQNRRQRHQTL